MKSLTKQNDSKDPTLETLTKIEGHLRILVRCQLMPIYVATINSVELQKLYALTGKTPRAQLSKDFGMSAGKISMLWQKWEQAGLLVKDGLHYVQTL